MKINYERIARNIVSRAMPKVIACDDGTMVDVADWHTELEREVGAGLRRLAHRVHEQTAEACDKLYGPKRNVKHKRGE